MTSALTLADAQGVALLSRFRNLPTKTINLGLFSSADEAERLVGIADKDSTAFLRAHADLLLLDAERVTLRALIAACKDALGREQVDRWSGFTPLR